MLPVRMALIPIHSQDDCPTFAPNESKDTIMFQVHFISLLCLLRGAHLPACAACFEPSYKQSCMTFSEPSIPALILQ
jgi:hypothetical protein